MTLQEVQRQAIFARNGGLEDDIDHDGDIDHGYGATETVQKRSITHQNDANCPPNTMVDVPWRYLP